MVPLIIEYEFLDENGASMGIRQLLPATHPPSIVVPPEAGAIVLLVNGVPLMKFRAPDTSLPHPTVATDRISDNALCVEDLDADADWHYEYLSDRELAQILHGRCTAVFEAHNTAQAEAARFQSALADYAIGKIGARDMLIAFRAFERADNDQAVAKSRVDHAYGELADRLEDESGGLA